MGLLIGQDLVVLIFLDKLIKYMMVGQLVMFQFLGFFFGVVVGWFVGYVWCNEVLFGVLICWWVFGWVVGMRGQKINVEFENMRRWLESEGVLIGIVFGIQ